MKPTAEQTAAIKAANEILAKAGLPKYQPRLYPTLELEGVDAPVTVDLSRLVRISPSPFQSQWEVVGGSGKWHNRIGRHVGALEIVNSRAHGILLEFPDGQVQAFNPMDMFPWRGEQVLFQKQQLSLAV
ncbi:TPA: hypothetical protein RE968_003399 [Pseudomonas aeruginosa]|nr:hypothetical protein [Pseudomonas aeruginosa]